LLGWTNNGIGHLIWSKQLVQHLDLPSKIPFNPNVHADLPALFDGQASMNKSTIPHPVWLQVHPEQPVSPFGLEGDTFFAPRHPLFERCQSRIVGAWGNLWKMRFSSNASILQVDEKACSSIVQPRVPTLGVSVQRVKPVDMGMIVLARTISHKLERFNIEVSQARKRRFAYHFV
jgi:hypothetical protein